MFATGLEANIWELLGYVHTWHIMSWEWVRSAGTHSEEEKMRRDKKLAQEGIGGMY